MKTNKEIDVHHHIVPQAYIEMLKEINISDTLGIDFPNWTPESSFSFMKKVGIEKAIASISSPGVYFKEHKYFSKKISRWCNEYLAEMKNENPDRFGAFTCVPLGFVQESVTELKYALDVLKLDGVCLLTHYDGKYLGDDKYDEFLAELNKRKAVVYIHPTDPADEYNPKFQDDGMPNSLIEVTFDTTRAVANMMYKGVLDKYLNIKYILSHGGGTLPYLAWRLSMISYGQKGKRTPVMRALYDFLIKGAPEKGLKQLKNMYYDTALTSVGYALNTLNEFVGTSRIVFGSDFAMAKVAPIIAKNLDKHPEFSNEDHEKIDYKNVVELFKNLNPENSNAVTTLKKLRVEIEDSEK